MLTEEETHALLTTLCVNLGFCLQPKAAERIARNPPDDVREFTDTVFVAEGLEPATSDRRLYRQVRNVVAEAFQKAAIGRER